MNQTLLNWARRELHRMGIDPQELDNAIFDESLTYFENKEIFYNTYGRSDSLDIREDEFISGDEENAGVQWVEYWAFYHGIKLI